MENQEQGVAANPGNVRRAQEYLQQNMEKFPLEELRNTLIQNGYEVTDVDAAVANIEANPTVVASSGFSIGSLFVSSWLLFKKVALKLLVVLGVAQIPAVILSFLGREMPSTGEALVHLIEAPLDLILFIVYTILSIVTLGIATKIIVEADSERQFSFLQAIRESLPLILPFFGVSFLSGVLVFAASLFFVLPGIVLAVWFCLAPYAFFSEGYRRIEALKRSRELVSGYWWAVLGRLVLLFVLLVIASIPLAAILLAVPALDTAAVNVSSAVIGAYVLVFIYNIYKALRAIKGQ